MFVAVEGMDGVGKSTISMMISQKLNMTYIEKPMKHFFNLSDNEYNKLCNEIWNCENANANLCFFILGNLLSRTFDKNVVVDRHILSSYFWDSNPENECIFYYFSQGNVVPDITFILYCSVETRIERIRKRNIADEDLESQIAIQFGYDKMIDFANNIHMPYVIIDTEQKSIEEVFSVCKEIIDDYNNRTYDDVYELCDYYNNLFYGNNPKVFRRILRNEKKNFD